MSVVTVCILFSLYFCIAESCFVWILHPDEVSNINPLTGLATIIMDNIIETPYKFIWALWKRELTGERVNIDLSV